MARQVLRDLLIVSGEQLTEEVLAEQLRPSQYQVRGARTSVEALGLARQQKPDAVLTDLRLSGESGLAVVQQFRARQELNDVPILLMVPAGNATLRTPTLEALRLGASDVVFKPIDLPLLREKLRMLLRMRELTEQRLRYIAMLSDDFEAPMQTIRGLTSLLRSSTDAPAMPDSRSAKLVDAVDRACDEMRRQVAVFLQRLRNEHGRLELEYQNSNINEIVRGACQEIGVDFRPLRECPPIVCDSMGITAALKSLLEELKRLAGAKSGHMLLRVGYEESRRRFILTISMPGAALSQQSYQDFLRRLGDATVSNGNGNGQTPDRSLTFPRMVVEGHGGSMELGPPAGDTRLLLIYLPAIPPLAPPINPLEGFAE